MLFLMKKFKIIKMPVVKFTLVFFLAKKLASDTVLAENIICMGMAAYSIVCGT